MKENGCAEEAFFKKERGMLIVLSGPSGAGKGTVCNVVRRDLPELKISVSETTRAPREKEIPGISYNYVSKETFEKRIDMNYYLEHAQVYKNYYGTPKENVEKFLEEGYDVILEIDIQGAANVRRNFKEGVYIFIAPPSMKELRRRIEGRGTESKEQREMRLACAYEEMRNTDDYSYIVINDDKDEAARQVEAIILAEHSRTERLKSKVNEILER